jgi:DNA ligase 1
MEYSALAQLYEKLEGRSGKIEKTELISCVLKDAPDDILPKIVMLINGAVFPPWSEEEIGVASQLMAKAIAKSYGMQQDDVIKSFKKTGDLGKTVEELGAKKKQSVLGVKRDLQIEKVFDNMQLMARQSSGGSQDRKLNMITELLIQAKPKEAKYIVRMILGEIRVGVAEGIIRDAISKAFDVTSEDVECAWFMNPDYGEIARIAKESGTSGLKKVKAHLGKPIMVQLAEKAPSLEEAVKSFDNVALEYKYDGARFLIHKKGETVWIFTRRLENVTKAFPEVASMCKANLKADECIIDSECISINPSTGRPMPFQTLSQRIKRKYDIDKVIKEIPVNLNVFDIVYLDGKMLFDKNLEERREILSKIIKVVPGKMQLAKQLVTNDVAQADKFYKEALDAGHEGLIVKNLKANYQPGRRVSGGWLKVKPVMESLDLVITGALWGTGKRAGTLGSYILSCQDAENGKFLECGMLGSGLKEKKTESGDVTLEDMTKMLQSYIELESGSQVKIRPKVVLEVAYEEIQKSPTYSSGWALRFPRFIRVRWDKGPDEADTTERIEKLYEMQKGKGSLAK